MAGARRRPYIRNRNLALAGGVAGMALAAFCFRDAYERRGRQRSQVASWLGI